MSVTLSETSTKKNLEKQLIQRRRKIHQLVITCNNKVHYTQNVDLEIIV